MPKIKNQRIYADRGGSVEVEISFSTKDNLFTCRFKDKELTRYAEANHSRLESLRQHTYDETVSAARELFEACLSEGLTQKKVIFLEAYTHQSKLNTSNNPFYEWQRNTDVQRKGVMLRFAVKWLVIKGNIPYFCDKEYKEYESEFFGTMKKEKPELTRVESHDFNRWRMLDYSEELEAFLKKTEAALNEMAGKMDEFFRQDDSLLLGAIQTTKLLT